MKDKRFNFRKPPEAKKQEKEDRSLHKPSKVRQFSTLPFAIKLKNKSLKNYSTTNFTSMKRQITMEAI